MSAAPDLAKALTVWANRNTTVKGLLSIGSRERPASDSLERADSYSDWDFQVISSKVSLLIDRDWANSLEGLKLKAFAVRRAQIGGVPKINVVFEGAEMDLVIIPLGMARVLKVSVMLGLHKREGRIRRRVQDLAEVIRPGWRLLKGEQTWGKVIRRIVDDVPDPKLEDDDLLQLAEGLYCDYVWCLKKIGRGELRAVQRILYREMLEANLQLLHELKRRRREKTFTKARRMELTSTSKEVEAFSVSPALNSQSLREALGKVVVTCRGLMRDLVGDGWRWPDQDQVR
jgi:hypothetical protein